MIQIISIPILAYILARLLNGPLERENEAARLVIADLKAKEVRARTKYQERINMMNTAFDQYRREHDS